MSEGGKVEEDDDRGGGEEGSEDEGNEDEKQVACGNHWWIPSPLIPLEGKAVEPKVRDDRVNYAECTNRGDCSDMTMSGLVRLAKCFPWPEGVELRLPCADGGALANYPRCIVVHEESLKAGFRLPLHPFIRDFLALEKYCPAELTPNSWRCILAFLLKSKELNLIPSYEVFKSVYRKRSDHDILRVYCPDINLISNPHLRNSWGRKWFLVCQSEVFHFNFPMYPGDHRWCKDHYTSRKEDITQCENTAQEFRKLLPDLKPSYKKVITASLLEEAGLSLPLPDKGRFLS